MKNKVVVITGSSSGIGKACAWHFAKNGSKVVLVARSDDKLKEIGDEMMLAGFKVLTIKAEIRPM